MTEFRALLEITATEINSRRRGRKKNSKNCEVAKEMKPKIIIANVDHTQFVIFWFFDYSGILQALQLYKKPKDGKHTRRNGQRNPCHHMCESMLPFISFHSIWSGFPIQPQRSFRIGRLYTLRPLQMKECEKRRNIYKKKIQPQPVRYDIHKKVKCMEFQLNSTKL